MRINIKEYVAERKKAIATEVAACKGKKPSLLILQVGDNKASNAYISGKMKDCAEVGIQTTLYRVNHNDTNENYELLRGYLKNNGANYNGIILQEPCGLTEGQRRALLNLIADWQDVDGFKPNSWHWPCTPQGILNILEDLYGEDGGNVITVVGRGALVGKPLIPLLVDEGWTVLCANSRTPDLKALTSMSDVVVSATGCRNLITRDMLKDGAFVIDAGITFDENGKMCGDCDKSMYDDETIQITTVPGGVGLTTRLELLENVMESFRI